MKTIKVVAAVICDNMKEKNKIFATARGYGELKGGWEFPGGKIEAVAWLPADITLIEKIRRNMEN